MDFTVNAVRGKYDFKRLGRLHDDLIRREQREIKQDLERTVSTWRTKVRFTVADNVDGSFSVYTANPIYRYVDGGTKPHKITARRAPSLAFYASGFRAKTVPNRLSARKGSAANANFRRPLTVNHPGTRPRNYSKIVAELSERRINRGVARISRNNS